MDPKYQALIICACTAFGAITGCEIAERIFPDVLLNGQPATAFCLLAIAQACGLVTGGVSHLLVTRHYRR